MWWGIHDGIGWWMLFGGAWMVFFWGAIIALAVWGVRALTGRGDKPTEEDPQPHNRHDHGHCKSKSGFHGDVKSTHLRGVAPVQSLIEVISPGPIPSGSLELLPVADGSTSQPARAASSPTKRAVKRVRRMVVLLFESESHEGSTRG